MLPLLVVFEIMTHLMFDGDLGMKKYIIRVLGII